MSDRSVHPATPRCRRITWPHGRRPRDPHARWICACGASGNVHETEKNPTKEKR